MSRYFKRYDKLRKSTIYNYQNIIDVLYYQFKDYGTA